MRYHVRRARAADATSCSRGEASLKYAEFRFYDSTGFRGKASPFSEYKSSPASTVNRYEDTADSIKLGKVRAGGGGW